MCGHLGVFALTGKRAKGDKNSVIKEHHLICNHSFGLDDFSILGKAMTLTEEQNFIRW